MRAGVKLDIVDATWPAPEEAAHAWHPKTRKHPESWGYLVARGASPRRSDHRPVGLVIAVVRTLDLYCGGGGSSWGARAAGANIVAGIDAWELATRTFADNFPGAKTITRRISEQSQFDVLERVAPFDLILASPECTNHSCARGARERDEESRRTALHVLRYVRHFRPRWVVIENVVHMRSWHGYDELVATLKKDLRYHIDCQLLNAADFGVPQARKRLFIICDRERPIPPVGGLPDARQQTASTVIDPAGTWRAGPLDNGRRAKRTLRRAKRAMAELGPDEPFLIVYYGSDGSGGWQKLDQPLRTVTTLDRFGLVDYHKAVPTLRMLQVPELIRAMGFHGSSRVRLARGTRRDRIKLLGNAVCPPVMEAIVLSITNHS